MAKWKLYAVFPALAALFVCAPILLSPSGSKNTPPDTSGANPIAALPSPFEVAFAVGIVLLLAVAGIIVVRRVQGVRPANASSSIVIKETRRIAPKRSLHVMRAVDRLLLVAESEHGLSLICDLTPQDGAPTEFDIDEADEEAHEDDEEEGATPRDLVLPAQAPRKSPSPQRRNATGNARRAKPAALADFRELLNRIG